jgi:hypothetical protein
LKGPPVLQFLIDLLSADVLASVIEALKIFSWEE